MELPTDFLSLGRGSVNSHSKSIFYFLILLKRQCFYLLYYYFLTTKHFSYDIIN